MTVYLLPLTVSCIGTGPIALLFMLPNESVEVRAIPADHLPQPRGMFLVTPKRTTRVQRIGDLKGHVKITTGDEALLFLRVLTSPATAGLTDLPAIAEVEPRSAATLNLFLRDKESYAAAVHDHLALPGMVSDYYAKSYFLGADVRKSRRHFEISRVIAEPGENFYARAVYRVTETVGDKDRTPPLFTGELWKHIRFF